MKAIMSGLMLVQSYRYASCCALLIYSDFNEVDKNIILKVGPLDYKVNPLSSPDLISNARCIIKLSWIR